mmetsp:Transcript_27976/g.87207  ORF Transcript_27976/g.87207 Transcript_27976/m.87207 type:complete len:236 (-) Transcript_27976:752-1459(-)
MAPHGSESCQMPFATRYLAGTDVLITHNPAGTPPHHTNCGCLACHLLCGRCQTSTSTARRPSARAGGRSPAPARCSCSALRTPHALQAGPPAPSPARPSEAPAASRRSREAQGQRPRLAHACAPRPKPAAEGPRPRARIPPRAASDRLHRPPRSQAPRRIDSTAASRSSPAEAAPQSRCRARRHGAPEAPSLAQALTAAVYVMILPFSCRRGIWPSRCKDIAHLAVISKVLMRAL